MKNILFIALFFGLFCALVSCESDTVAPAWRIEGPRILAIQADKPVFSPGDTVDLSLLLAGLDTTGRTGTTVEWSMGNVLQSAPADRTVRFDIPAESDIDIYFGSETAGRYTATGSATVELRVVARLTDGTLLPAKKSFLLAKKSVAQALHYQSPVIARIIAEIPGHSGLSVAPGDPIFIPEGVSAETIKLQAELADNSSIELYGYRWYVENNMAYTEAEIETGALSSKAEVDIPELGALTVYLVVEDRSEEVKTSLYHGGVDFVSFTVQTGPDISDKDVVPTDEETPDTDTLLTD